MTNNGTAATLADVKVGDKIFVQGTNSGTNVKATSISLGHPEKGGHREKDIETADDTEAATTAATE